MNHVRQIGPFALAEVLGEGTGTVLYRAIRVNSSRPPQEVCIRIAQNPAAAESSAAITNEYEILRALDNPRLPKVYGHYASECAVGMSYYSGATLADALQARSDDLVVLGVSTAIDIIADPSVAASYAGHVKLTQLSAAPRGVCNVGASVGACARAPTFRCSS